MSSFLPSEYVKDFASLFDPSDSARKLAEPYLLFSGFEKTIFEIEAGSFEKRVAEMVAFSKAGRPLLVASIDVLAPGKQ